MHQMESYTGFLANEKQADKILDFFRRFRGPDTMVLVDPVMGDNGSAYGIYTEGLQKKMLQLADCAQVITPNLTEALLLLYGKAEMDRKLRIPDGSDRGETLGNDWENRKRNGRTFSFAGCCDYRDRI